MSLDFSGSYPYSPSASTSQHFAKPPTSPSPSSRASPQPTVSSPSPAPSAGLFDSFEGACGITLDVARTLDDDALLDFGPFLRGFCSRRDLFDDKLRRYHAAVAVWCEAIAERPAIAAEFNNREDDN
jgi:hypothetical protein